MDTTAWAPRLLHPDEVWTYDKTLILLHLARSFDDLLLGLEKDQPALEPDVALTVMVQLIRPWVHPLLTDLNALDLMVGLKSAVAAQDQYLLFGTWDDEHDDALAARSVNERHDLLAADVDRWVQRLITALEVVS